MPFRRPQPLLPDQAKAQGHGDDPQDPGQLDGGRHLQGLVAIGQRRPHHRAGVVDAQGGPPAEPLLGEAQGPADQGKGDQPHRVQQEDHAQGRGSLMLLGGDDRRHGRDGAATANGGADVDEQAGVAAHPHAPGEPDAQGQGQGDAYGGGAQAAEPGLEHHPEIHPGPQAHHRPSQERMDPSPEAILMGIA